MKLKSLILGSIVAAGLSTAAAVAAVGDSPGFHDFARYGHFDPGSGVVVAKVDQESFDQFKFVDPAALGLPRVIAVSDAGLSLDSYGIDPLPTVLDDFDPGSLFLIKKSINAGPAKVFGALDSGGGAICATTAFTKIDMTKLLGADTADPALLACQISAGLATST